MGDCNIYHQFLLNGEPVQKPDEKRNELLLIADFMNVEGNKILSVRNTKSMLDVKNEDTEKQNFEKKIGKKFIDTFKKHGLEEALRQKYKIESFEVSTNSCFLHESEVIFYFKNFELHCSHNLCNNEKKSWIEIPYHQDQQDNPDKYVIKIYTYYPFIIDDPNADLIYKKMLSIGLDDVLSYYKRYEYESSEIKVHNRKKELIFDRTIFETGEGNKVYLSTALYNKIKKVEYLSNFINENGVFTCDSLILDQKDLDMAFHTTITLDIDKIRKKNNSLLK